MTELSPESRSILDAGRDLDGAGDLEKARVRRALFAKIAAGGALLAATSTAAAESSATVAGTTAASTAGSGAAAGGTLAAVATPLAKILIPLAVVVGGAAGGFVAWRAQRAYGPPVGVATTVAPVVAPMTPPVAPPEPVAPAIAPVVEPAPRAAHPARRPHVAARPEAALAPTNDLGEETALLASANAELRRGDAREALSILDGYDRRFPAGVLREEVVATRVIARCQLGPPGQRPGPAARRGAQAFLARHAASPLAPRVRTSCE